MRILFTGATGVVGRRAVPLLTEAGHEVHAVYRSDKDRQWVESAGATPIRLDLFDTDAVHEAANGVDAIVHFATSIPPLMEMRRRSAWDANDRLRSIATKNLVAAALKNETGRFIQESVTFFYRDSGDGWIDEGTAVEPSWEVLDSALVAEGYVSQFTSSGGIGVSLRLASLYGPGRASAEYVAGVTARRFPVVGTGGNYVSFLHADDAATAVVAALEAPAGIYNVTDDQPVLAGEAVKSLAGKLGAKTPRQFPRWVAGLALGGAAKLLTNSQRVSNAHFKRATGWQPRFRSVLTGWDDVVADSTTATQPSR